MNRIKAAAAMAAISLLLAFTACGSSSTPTNFNDGTYIGRSADRPADEDGNGAGYGEVEIEIAENKIISCTFKTYELDGTLKDENYGADLSKENRMKAQKAVQSADKYAELLLEKGAIDSVDVISGATVNHDEFVEAVNEALKSAAVSE